MARHARTPRHTRPATPTARHARTPPGTPTPARRQPRQPGTPAPPGTPGRNPDSPARPHPPAHPAGNPDGPARPDAVEHADRSRDGGAAQGTDDRPSSLRRPGGGQPTRPAPTWPSQFAQVLAETLAGSRPPGQLTPWTTERARGHIRRLGPLLAASQEPRIRRIVASTPSSGVVEMAVVVRFGPRIRALAIRLERANTPRVRAWQCTAIEAA